MNHSMETLDFVAGQNPSLNLRDIITQEVQGQIQEAFAYATGFGVVFIDRWGNHIGEGSNFTQLCTEINETEEGRCLCAQSNRRAVNLALETGEAAIYICHAGMVNIEIPLIVDGEYLGAVTAGQVFAVNEADFAKDPIRSEIDWQTKESFAALYDKIPVLSTRQIRATAGALEKIAQYIIQNYQKHQMQERMLRQTIELRELAVQLSEARYDALSKQVKPHFLFNVLNSVTCLIELGEPEKAREMLTSFAKLIRYQLQDARPTIYLAEEINCIRAFLNIQHIRFGDLVRYEIVEEPALGKLEIPFFALQPLVENALEHGIIRQDCFAKIFVVTSKSKDSAKIMITDDGAGMDRAKLESVREQIENDQPGREHLGIRSSYLRFKQLFPNKFTLSIRSAPNLGTELVIELFREANPQRKSVLIGDLKSDF